MSILKMRKLGCNRTQELMQNHTANEQQDQDLAPCLLTKPFFFYTVLHCSFLSLFRDENNGSCLGR